MRLGKYRELQLHLIYLACCQVEAKKAVPKDDQPATRYGGVQQTQRTRKIFVGGLAPSVDELAFRK